MRKAITLLVAATAVVAGCSNSDDTPDPGYASFAEIAPDAIAMRSAYVDVDGNFLMGVVPATDADIPDSGTAQYLGFVAGDLNGADLIGQLTVDVMFQTETISSSATNFFHETQGAYTGTLAGTGVLVPDQLLVPQISTSLVGTLTNNSVDYATNIALEGDIVANGVDTAGAIAGYADGNVGMGVFTGAFVAER